MTAYYNEIDPFAAAWLRELIRQGEIAPGEVDTRAIQEVSVADLRGFTQCHFFAGIGGWSLALRLAGWPDDRPIWTGSCPCQPFSAAGKGHAFADPRHLWPFWFRLIAECRPLAILGEQVDAAIRLGWWDLVCDDLEGLDYACWAKDLPSACIGETNIRQRLWWVADAVSAGRQPVAHESSSAGERVESSRQGIESGQHMSDAGGLADTKHAERRTVGVGGINGRDGAHSGREEAHSESGACGEVRGLANTDVEGSGWRGIRGPGQSDDAGAGATRERPAGFCADGGMADTNDAGSQGRRECGDGPGERPTGAGGVAGRWPLPSHLGGRPVDWLRCRDGKWRPVESGAFPLAHELPARVGRLRGYGNAINPEVAAEVIRAYMDIRQAAPLQPEPDAP